MLEKFSLQASTERRPDASCLFNVIFPRINLHNASPSEEARGREATLTHATRLLLCLALPLNKVCDEMQPYSRRSHASASAAHEHGLISLLYQLIRRRSRGLFPQTPGR